ncbi:MULTISPECIES: aldo/keto reductase [unclassified Microbacterium]|uniref:aldo/keto reductase n=1 Tax=unclassified Microbacterium TaxID=2609290 RepID=UPI000B34F771|nr:aldo/keto reductase [Microbacterium sp. JB110]RCS60406.1 aldo/keto reductase [Microbacterium sp. JB110]
MAEPIRIPGVTLNDGSPFAELGLGTYKLTGDDGIAAVEGGIRGGYRVLDTAVNYGNEREVGEGVRRSGVDRDDIIVTTKVPGRHHGYDEAIASGRESNETLGLGRIDLLLIHWPNPSVDKYVDTFRGMIELREQGVVRSVGVSNFTIAMLERLIAETGVTPSVNQIELHPYFPQAELRAFHAEHGIRTESWSPLARRTELLQEESLLALAEKYGVTPSQLVLRWHTQLDATPIPKSSSPDRQRENADVFGFDLDPDDIEQIASLERGRIFDADPDVHEEM